MIFHDRRDAGRQLAHALTAHKNKPDTLVLALPRGGVPVGYEIAKALHLPLDLMLVRKLGTPGHEELAMGAIAEGGVQVLNQDIIRNLGISSRSIERVVETEGEELRRRSHAYRIGTPVPELEGKTIILVDDGMATGANMRAAARAASQRLAKTIIIAIPVASDSAYGLLREEADEIVCLNMPEPFYGVGAFYRDFSQTSDEEVKTLLKEAMEYERA